MLNKMILATGVAASLLAIAVPFASAQTTAPTSSTATKIACVGSAVATREAALDTAIAAHASAMNTAYTTRASALAAAYGQTTTAEVRTAVKAAWNAFRASTKSAQKEWLTARNAAWKAYRTTAVACKAPVGVGDGGNSGSEVSGN